MRLRAISGPPASVEADVLAVPIYREDTDMAADLAELDTASGGAISRAISWGEFNPIEHPVALVDAGDLSVDHLLAHQCRDLAGAGRGARDAWRRRPPDG